MGIPGAGKSRIAEEYAARGYLRLNRDERGGSLRELAGALDEALSSGSRRIVLDNTYLTRAARNDVIEAARRHRVPARCVWLDTPLAQAQVNLVERLLERFGSLPSPEQLRELARREPGVLAPTSQMRAAPRARAAVGRRGLRRASSTCPSRGAVPRRGRLGVFVAAAALAQPGWEVALRARRSERAAPGLRLEPRRRCRRRSTTRSPASPPVVSGPVESALCPHGAGPPSCWCRPPLPGLPLAFARAHGIDVSRSVLVGVGPAHRTLATTLGARYVPVA